MYKGRKTRRTMAGRALALALGSVLVSSNLAITVNGMTVYATENGDSLSSEEDDSSKKESSVEDTSENAGSDSASEGADTEKTSEDSQKESGENKKENTDGKDNASEDETNKTKKGSESDSSDDSASKSSSDESDASASSSSDDAASESSSVEEKNLLAATKTVASDVVADQGEEGYEYYTEDVVIADIRFGTERDVSSKDTYSEENGYGFKDEDYSTEARGWSGGVYYPRQPQITDASSNISDYSDYVEVKSRVWTETESSGYGVYTYETTSSFGVDLYNADYEVEVTLTNPTSSDYAAYLEAEDITKASGITVKAGENVTTTFEANLVDGHLDLKFLGNSSASSMDAASQTSVYLSEVKITRLKTQDRGDKPTVFIASDSTVQTYDQYYYPQTGWGQVLSSYFGEFVEERECDDCKYNQSQVYETANAIIENRAIGGRSSKSFIDEGKLDDILEDIKPGDYILIQWGHNDATYSRPNRYVSSSDFGNYIMTYVKGAYERGAIPVLVTPVARYSYTTDSEGNLDSFASNFESYRQVMLSLAKENNIPYIDLTQRSIDVCNSFGIEGSKMLFLKLAAGEVASGAYAGGVDDSTHLQYYGALKFAGCVAQGIVDYANGDVDGANDELDFLASLVVIDSASEAPEKVTGLTVTGTGATSVSLSWDAASSAELYYIYRKELAEGEKAESVDFKDATKYSVSSKTSYVDSSCKAGATYVYAIAGFNSFGVGELSDIVSVKTKTAGLMFDFNYNNSPTMKGWTGVNQNQKYDEKLGYGWVKTPGNGRYRNKNGNAASSDMADDFNLGSGEFAVDLPNGSYEVTIYAGDLLSGTSTIKPAYSAEGVSIGSIACKQSIGSCTGTVVVKDGQLNITVGGSNQYINGLTITALLQAPGNLAITELSFENTTASFLLSFTKVEEAASYNVYQKGETDQDFVLVKSFTKEELVENELDSRAMTATLGETYSYYMTCVTADGTESAPSNVVTQAMLDESITKPVAPKNVRCTSPEEGATELQNTITIEWDANDASENVIKYIIYRSSKAEKDKGFKEFVKVGESKETSFTDESEDLATNIHYYYKVAAMNAGGVGEMSEACMTPIAGSLMAGGLETYVSRALVCINLSGDAGAETKVSATDAEGKEITSGVYLSWRSFPGDFSGGALTTTFDVYRNGSLIASGISVTNLVDEGGSISDTYKVVGSNDSSLGLTAKDTSVWANQYMEFSLNKPEDETMPDGSTCTYTANDMSVGDLDGDGELELIVKWYPSNAKDNSGSGYTGKSFIDGYDVDFGTGYVKQLWRIDLGVNIRSGAHYTQFQVWDYDADGIAEIAVKTADGTTTYQNQDGALVETGYVGECNADALPTDVKSDKYDYRNSSGYVLDGPEYFTMFKGNTGEIIDTVDYVPARGSVSAWGDGYGNRVDRFLSATAYLNGTTPFAVFTRGYYTRTALTAYYLTKTTDEDGNEVEQIGVYWKFDTDNLSTSVEVTGQGNHGLSVNDVDGDGKDEIIYGSIVVDHDGSLLYSTQLGHGDAMHVGDWIPGNPGLEIMCVHEHDNVPYHVEIHDAETGKILVGYYTGKDTGRGMASDIDPTAPGAEFWSIANPNYMGNDEPAWNSRNASVFSAIPGEVLIPLSYGATPAVNFSLYWDGDLLAEMQDHTFDQGAYAPLTTTIEKWDYENSCSVTLFESAQVYTSNGTKGNLGLVGDILGDFRDEIIARCSFDNSKIRIYSTTITTDYVVPCSLTDLAYREGIAWQNVGYNQPAHTSYLISEGLLTAQLFEQKVSSTEAVIGFTAACDGSVYGHEVEGYVVKRALVTEDENGKQVTGEYETIATLKNADLVKSDEEGSDFVYTDKTVAGGNFYAYKIASIVDGKESFASAALIVQTTVSIKKLNEKIDTIELVEDTPLAEGKTVTDLLTQKKESILVTDTDGNEQSVVITWDAGDVDIENVGTYTAYANIRGYSENPVSVTVKVVANVPTGYEPFEDITVLVGRDVVLPATVKATFLNGTANEIPVSFDTTALDVNKTGIYTVTGKIEGTEDTISLTVRVVDDYIVSIAPTYAEVNYLDKKFTLPETVSATYASDTVKDVAVVWETSNIDISSLGTSFTVEGTVEGFEEKVTANVTVRYPAAYKFDFGIDPNLGTEGWTTVTVNPKGVAKTLDDYGSSYTAERGYGFENGAATMQGRTEKFSQEGVVPTNVYNDFALTAGETFLVDVENGEYQIDFISSSALKSTVTGTAEGVNFNVSSAAATYNVGTIDVKVEDGQLTIKFGGNNDRLGGIVIRKVIVDDSYYGYPDEPDPSEEPDEPQPEEPQDQPSKDEAPKGRFVNSWGSLYYVLEDGTKLTGMWEIDGEYYFFKDNGKAARSSFVTIDDKTYYFDVRCHRVSGFVTFLLSKYYFDERGVMATNAIIEDSHGNAYYFDANGLMVRSSFVELSDGTHYFDITGKMIRNRKVLIWFRWYKFDENGVLK